MIKIAEIWFRIDTKQFDHKRIEYNFSSLLADIGGIKDLLLMIISIAIGGFLSFNADIEIILSLYKGPLA